MHQTVRARANKSGYTWVKKGEEFEVLYIKDNKAYFEPPTGRGADVQHTHYLCLNEQGDLLDIDLGWNYSLDRDVFVKGKEVVTMEDFQKMQNLVNLKAEL